MTRIAYERLALGFGPKTLFEYVPKMEPTVRPKDGWLENGEMS